MRFDPTITGLAMDMVGFLIVFTFGGFDVGRVSIVAESSKEKNVTKLAGGALIVLGFGLQIVGRWAPNYV